MVFDFRFMIFCARLRVFGHRLLRSTLQRSDQWEQILSNGEW